MHLIPRPIHGLLDYFVGLLLAASPWLLGFSGQGIATWLPVALGLGALLYSLLTNYELGVLRVIPFRVHLALDMLSGALLAASPWLFGFADRMTQPHLAFGIFEIAAAIVTRISAPAGNHRRIHRHAHGTALPKLP